MKGYLSADDNTVGILEIQEAFKVLSFIKQQATVAKEFISRINWPSSHAALTPPYVQTENFVLRLEFSRSF